MKPWLEKNDRVFPRENAILTPIWGLGRVRFCLEILQGFALVSLKENDFLFFFIFFKIAKKGLLRPLNFFFEK